ncbi:hydrogenase maturation nickel metallochaperone HypA [Caloramator sp. mosi_1]|uniref:hydrogenase maturation nickel metallochaperone HypA/HybF n=1 Tax=Caloramator sp. mosi_1 TaxID=3023090 RepID=UPI002362759E|nr:hydrogenase maturation nickel metallochaperone HypA [Caloramator sp. mosi_1]WDC83834.1 hydrogenase maturation nickel metallochaperone HypA [Caloramator sp. mosi_1]
MHELAITEGIIKIVEKEAKIIILKGKCNQNSSWGIIGSFPQLIQDYFDIASKGTIADGAELVIRRVEAKLKCNECGSEGKVENHRLRCKSCGSLNVTITSGKEFYVDSLEVD